MTKLEIFNKVYLALVKQGFPSMTRYGACVYFGDEQGTACGIGHLVSVSTRKAWDLVKPSNISAILKHSETAALAPAWMFEPGMSEFLEDIQAMHDDAADDGEFLSKLKLGAEWVANKYGFTVPETA